MTLEEYIEVLAQHQRCDVCKCIKFNCSECEFAIPMDKVPTDSEILRYFEELRIYRKALDLACKRIALDDDWDWQEWRKYILDKVRGEQ